MNNPKLYMLVGLPYSGKSTWTENQPKDGYMVIDTDSYIEQKAKENNISYNEAFKLYYKDAETSMYQRLNIAIASDLDIYWDQTNLTVKSRKKKLNMVPSKYNKVAVVFPQLELCETYNRMGKRTKMVPMTVIHNLKDTYIEPTKDEGFDYVIQYTDDLQYL